MTPDSSLSIEDLRRAVRQRKEAEAQREALWYVRARQHARRVMMVTAVVYGITFPLQTLNGELPWIVWLGGVLCAGALGYGVGRQTWGIPLATPIIGLGCIGYSMLGLVLEWWKPGSGAYVGTPAAAGSWLMILFMWVGWVVLGGVMGAWNQLAQSDLLLVSVVREGKAAVAQREGEQNSSR